MSDRDGMTLLSLNSYQKIGTVKYVLCTCDKMRLLVTHYGVVCPYVTLMKEKLEKLRQYLNCILKDYTVGLRKHAEEK